MPAAPTDGPAVPVPDDLAAWLVASVDQPGPFTMRRLAGGNSNETWEVRCAAGTRRGPGPGRWILRHPPAHLIDASAHSMGREHVVLRALSGAGAPVPRPLGLHERPDGSSFLLMEAIDGVSLTDRRPAGYPDPAASAAAIGATVVDALARVHLVDWEAAGLEGFGRPEGFLARQVPRWQRQLDGYRTRDLPHVDELSVWLAANLPAEQPPAVLHGDFHLDNCLLSWDSPVRVEAVIDWEMATIGDPLLDLGLFLALWGDGRPADPAMPRIQAVSRVAGTPPRTELAERYASATGRSIDGLRWYMAFACWKLAAIVEGAYAQHVRGELDTDYARALEHDVPALLQEAAQIVEDA